MSHKCDRLLLSDKHNAAVALGSLGGKARAKALSPERRKEIATAAAKSRWLKRDRERNMEERSGV
jgi:hypothetical protein